MRHESLEQDGRETIYVPYRQEASRDLAIVVRTSADPGRLVAPIQAEVLALGEHLPIHDVRLMTDLVNEAVAPTRFALSLISTFAVVSVLLAAVGLYGVVSYWVRKRTHELGIRLALGATGAALARRVMRQAMVLASVGLAIGLALSLFASRAVTSLLFGVSPLDPATYLMVCVILALVTLFASYLPARRASRVDPAEALRAD